MSHFVSQDMTALLTMQVAFHLSAAALATVQATRTSFDAQPPTRDILVLHPRGRLSLYVGAYHVCDVSVRAPGPPDQDAQMMRPAPSRPTGEILPG